jgi:putative Mn2+ efflux pump MntP
MLFSLMTIVFASVALQIPADVTHYLATVLFFGFGLKSLYDAFTGEGYVNPARHSVAIRQSLCN